MSDQRRSDAVISLEEIFRSREFGRRPTRWESAPVATVEMTEPPQLEQVFLSELFGHSEALFATPSSGVTPFTPSTQRPILVVLPGGRDAERDLWRYRGAIGAVSGVAAAALVVAGMTSGTGSRSEQPTVSAEGKPPGHATVPSGGAVPGPGGVATPPSASGQATGQPPRATGGSAGGTPIAQLTSATTPATPAVVVQVPPLTPVEVPPAPPASPPTPGGGTPPSGPSPGGAGGVLTPVFVTAGSTVSAVGSTVTAASNDLAQAVPAVSPVTGLLGNVGATVTNLGQSLAGA
jgi:hypothetical protein